MGDKTIITLTVYVLDNISTPNGAYNYDFGYYSNYETVERVIKSFGTVGIMFITKERYLDKITDWTDNVDDDDLVCIRQYMVVNDEVVMVHETKHDYQGHIGEIKYKPGDIIKYVGYDGIETAIIRDTPYTTEEYKKRKLALDEMDDSYTVYTLGEGDTHDHIMTVFILGLADVPECTRKVYEAKLEERKEMNK